MKNKNTYLPRVVLTVMAFVSYVCCIAQQGKGFVTMRVPLQYTWYTVDVSVVADPSARGTQKGQSLQTGLQLSYERFIKNSLSAELGVGVSTAVFKVVRGYNTRYMGSLLSHLVTTNPDYRYALLQLPVRINYRIKQLPKMDLFVGATNLFNFTWRQRYGHNDKMTQFYFFSNAVQVNAKLRYKVNSKLYVGAEPTIQVYHQWSKDDVVYDYGLGFQQPRPAGVSKYYKQFFDAVGIALSLSYKL